MDWHYLHIMHPFYARCDMSRVILAISARKHKASKTEVTVLTCVFSIRSV